MCTFDHGQPLSSSSTDYENILHFRIVTKDLSLSDGAGIAICYYHEDIDFLNAVF